MKRVLGLLLVVLAACGGSARPAAPGKPEPTTRVTVYFLTDGATAALGVRRTVTRRSPFARQALDELLRGPPSGLTSAIPAGTRVRSFSIARSGEATVDLVGLDPDEQSAPQIARVAAQVARTLIGLSGIRSVRIRAEGNPWGFWDMQGNRMDRPWDYDALLGLFHICTAKPGTEAVPGDCFSALP